MEIRRKKLVFVTSYPPRECGIATFSLDLITSLEKLFGKTFEVEVCALENGFVNRDYPDIVRYQMDVYDPDNITGILNAINRDTSVAAVCIQHEFGLFHGEYGEDLLCFIRRLKKPLYTTFHTVLPKPNRRMRAVVHGITEHALNVIVMTSNARRLLTKHYGVDDEKISVIPHGTHLVSWKDPQVLKKKYGLENRLVMSTFGLLGPNKSIETALAALPEIVKSHPEALYLVLGKTHPEIVRREGDRYRRKLENLVQELGIERNVLFVNKYLTLKELLEYLQLTDLYLFTSKDPNQAVSGTFAYALSCACPIVSTPIPHALELLDESVGRIVGFEDHHHLARESVKLLTDDKKRAEMSLNAFHKTRLTVWENVAIAYAKLFAQESEEKSILHYNLPEISLDHLVRMTTEEGILQFSKLGIPDRQSGFTLDDNARALISVVMHYAQFKNPNDLLLMERYLTFVRYCHKPNGRFNNYVDICGEFRRQNQYTNLEDSNGRAIWALGYIVANGDILPDDLVTKAIIMISKSAKWMVELKSPRAISFVIKGLHFHNQYLKNQTFVEIIAKLGDRLIKLYNDSSNQEWEWFEPYLTYANGVMPEALLCAYQETKHVACKEVAVKTLNFLITRIFESGSIKVISNRGWLNEGEENGHYGEQPIDVAYTILALDTFTRILGVDDYKSYMTTAFEWFLGNNHLDQIIYSPVSGGCYDGLEEDHPNLNEGAESTVCYLISRLTMEKYAEKPVPKSVKYPLKMEKKRVQKEILTQKV